MKVIKASEIKMEKTNTNFCTGEIMRQILLSANESSDYLMGIHTFPKGVRNKFHVHNGEQILIITAGEGTVATEDEQWNMSAGDIIIVPAGLKHWHGANAESDLSHIAIVRAGDKLTQLED